MLQKARSALLLLSFFFVGCVVFSCNLLVVFLLSLRGKCVVRHNTWLPLVTVVRAGSKQRSADIPRALGGFEGIKGEDESLPSAIPTSIWTLTFPAEVAERLGGRRGASRISCRMSQHKYTHYLFIFLRGGGTLFVWVFCHHVPTRASSRNRNLSRLYFPPSTNQPPSI